MKNKMFLGKKRPFQDFKKTILSVCAYLSIYLSIFKILHI